MYKFAVLAAILASANAGLLSAPAVAYSAAPAVSSAYIQHAAPAVAVAPAPVAVAAPAVGASHLSVVRSPLGNQAISQYSKAVDSAFSSVRKFDTRITNDARIVSAYAAPAPVVSTYAAPAPVVSTYAAPAPVVSAYAAPAPVVATRAAAVAYSPAAVVSHATFTGLGASYAW